MSEIITLGIIQGIAEWLPVSSEGLIALAQLNFFGASGIGTIVQLALFLHFGTMAAALVYFWKDIAGLARSLFWWRNAGAKDRALLKFFIVATIVSGALGFLLLKGLVVVGSFVDSSARVFTGFIGFLLLVTALLQFQKKNFAERDRGDMTLADGILLGVAQGLAVLPGLSRSGLTVAVLLFRGVKGDAAFALSFLLSIPIVFLGNILLNVHTDFFRPIFLIGLFASFTFGLLTIHALLKFAEKEKIGYVAFVFGLLTFASLLI